MTKLVFAVASDDERRTIWEIELEGGFAIQEFLVKASDLPLGRHYHAHRTETFTILEGGGTLTTYKVDENGKVVSEAISVSLEAGQTIFVDRFTVHTFRLAPGTKMRCYSTLPLTVDADLNSAPEFPTPQ